MRKCSCLYVVGRRCVSFVGVLQAIAIVSVGSFTIAAILLSGLFVYDVFWVFGTEVMVTVAKVGVADLTFCSAVFGALRRKSDLAGIRFPFRSPSTDLLNSYSRFSWILGLTAFLV